MSYLGLVEDVQGDTQGRGYGAHTYCSSCHHSSEQMQCNTGKHEAKQLFLYLLSQQAAEVKPGIQIDNHPDIAQKRLMEKLQI